MNRITARSGDWVECIDAKTYPDCDYPDGAPVLGGKYKVREEIGSDALRLHDCHVFKKGMEIYFNKLRFKPCEPPEQQQEIKNMNNNDYIEIPIATPTLVYGHDIGKMSDAELIEKIKWVNFKIESLIGIPGGSRKIQRQIAEAQKALDKLVEQLDKDEIIE